jgi:hypothetical protein
VAAIKCVLCRQRKGKRHCPAKNDEICAQCCGEKRILEIDCPENCEYLKAGRERETAQEVARYMRVSEPHQHKKRERVFTRFEFVLAGLQGVIAAERLSSRDLVDADVADALDCVLRTLRTEERGVIYDSVSSNLRAESLRRQFKSLLESFRHPRETNRERCSLADLIECAEVLREVVASHMEEGLSPRSLVDFLARNLPRNAGTGRSPSSIILPGR